MLVATPNDRHGRADNGGSASDGGEVVAPQHEFVRWHVVHAVVHGMCGGFIAIGKLEDFLPEEFCIDEVSTDDHREADDN